MIQIYVGETDRLSHIDVDIWDCKKGKLVRRYMPPEKLYELIDSLKKAGVEVKLFRKEVK